MATSSAHATTNPQREPSMEEILASIRRIIEDNDAMRRPGDVQGAAREDHADEMVAEGEAELPPAAANTDRRDFALAAEEPDASSAFEPEPEPEPEPEASAETGEDWPLDIEMAELAELELPQDFASDVLAAETRDAAEAERAPLEAEAAGEQAVPASAGQASGIVSASTGRQVAAAFDELSEAFVQSRRRSFDDMAEDMLRPMLQDWLDNNLPTLVERLVREEIERIARGAAR